MNANKITRNAEPYTLFIDMNSFFASCEQQVNFYLRHRPVGVCVYTGREGCIISPSIEAKQKGVKTGMRLNEAMVLCPDMVPVETHPTRYREYHIKIMNVLRKYSDDVIPKSIDEAVLDLKNYKLLYKDPLEVAHKIKKDIRNEVGDWLKCSIGIAPNTFLAKLASDRQKPDGLVTITENNIDSVLSKLKLTDLPGIGRKMAIRFEKIGINTPLELRHADPGFLRRALNSIVGLYWYQRLNFMEVDMHTQGYKNMSAMRTVSSENRKSIPYLEELFTSLCMKLEQRMVRHNVFCSEVGIFISYGDGYGWKEHLIIRQPMQDGTDLQRLLKLKMREAESTSDNGAIINHNIRQIGVWVGRFISGDLVQYELFDYQLKKNQLRKTVYDVKDKFGKGKLMKANELNIAKGIAEDVIGFGSVKDMNGVELPEDDVRDHIVEDEEYFSY
jgi:DNA polymerase IV